MSNSTFRFGELFINGENKLEELLNFGRIIGLDSVAPNRYSTLFLIHLYFHSVILGRMNPAKVIREIRALEGLDTVSSTKPPLPFKHPPLKGLWHKHHLAEGISSMAANLKNGLKKYGLPLIEERARKAQEANEEKYITEEDITAIVNDAVHGNWMRRAEANELTGEWIIYAQHAGNNYYLCLGQHFSDDNHLSLRNQIDNLCRPEFPFLSDILTDPWPDSANKTH
jgi:hypothetical protein